MRGCRCSMVMGFTKLIEHFILQRKKVISMNTLYVGIDVSSKSNVVYLMLPNGDKHSNFSVANSREGSTQLVKRILSALTSHSLDTVLIGLEATSVYGDVVFINGWIALTDYADATAFFVVPADPLLVGKRDLGVGNHGG